MTAKELLDRYAAGERDLTGAYLTRADLSGANLTEADLFRADLTGAYLACADLTSADLTSANLAGANLFRADLTSANLTCAYLAGANLAGTVLDPVNKPNGNIEEFKRRGKYVYGYRTRAAGHIGEYQDGRNYNADYFSTCPETDCHPGLYVWPTVEQAKSYSGDPLIKVRIPAWAVHKTPTKWRCVEFYVMGGVK